jgi:hypothetical protein
MLSMCTPPVPRVRDSSNYPEDFSGPEDFAPFQPENSTGPENSTR